MLDCDTQFISSSIKCTYNFFIFIAKFDLYFQGDLALCLELINIICHVIDD